MADWCNEISFPGTNRQNTHRLSSPLRQTKVKRWIDASKCRAQWLSKHLTWLMKFNWFDAYLFLMGRSSPFLHCSGNGRCREHCWGPDLLEVDSFLWSVPGTSLAVHLAFRVTPPSVPPEYSVHCYDWQQSLAAPQLVHILQTAMRKKEESKKRSRVHLTELTIS